MRKTISQWIREFLGKRNEDSELPNYQPSPELITEIIGKVTGKTDDDNLILTSLKNALSNEKEISDNSDSNLLATPILETDNSDLHPDQEGEESKRADNSAANSDTGKSDSSNTSCCPYHVKRNIVKSIEEIERFTKEHEHAADVMKAVLTALAEMTLMAMKGKVNGAILLLLLNALNFNKAREEAYKEGELAGRNARIEEKYFPTVEDGLPHFHGMKERSSEIGIFSLARNA